MVKDIESASDKEFWQVASGKFPNNFQASKALGMDPKTVKKYMDRFGLSFPGKRKKTKFQIKPTIKNIRNTEEELIRAAKEVLNKEPEFVTVIRTGLSKSYIHQLKKGTKVWNKKVAATIIYKKQSDNKEAPEVELVVNLPKVNLFVPKFSKTEGDEEVALLLCSDGHAGKITSTFSKEVYAKRMEEVFQASMKLIHLHRNMYPIKKLVIANLGDNVQGENVHQGSKLGDTECGARDQVKYIAAPAWNDVLGSFKQQFETVTMECVPGNHGHEKLAPTTSSYDLILYDYLQNGIGREKGINIKVNDSWYSMFSIFGYKFMMFHGDENVSHLGVPMVAIERAIMKWYMQFHGFNYSICGHFHKAEQSEIGAGVTHIMNSTLVSDDDWVLKRMKISSTPSQTLLGIHPKYGITWRYCLVVDDKFLPEPFEKVGDKEEVK